MTKMITLSAVLEYMHAPSIHKAALLSLQRMRQGLRLSNYS